MRQFLLVSNFFLSFSLSLSLSLSLSANQRRKSKVDVIATVEFAVGNHKLAHFNRFRDHALEVRVIRESDRLEL